MSSPWRLPFEIALQNNAPQLELQVGTVSADGEPAVRTVIFRGLSAEGAPYFFTDTRTRKADHLRANPKVALHAWFPVTREQFRLTGVATLHGTHAGGPWAALRARAWGRFNDERRLAYLGPPPGHSAIEPVPMDIPSASPPEFLIISVEVTWADWVVLGPPSTRRGYRLLGSSWVQQALTP